MLELLHLVLTEVELLQPHQALQICERPDLIAGEHQALEVDELVEKPVEPQFLLDRVSKLIQASEARKSQTS